MSSHLDGSDGLPRCKRAREGHLVGKRARMRKIFPFGAGLKGGDSRSPDTRSTRPGLLQIGDSLDGAPWTVSAPRGTPNGNILRIRTEKTTTCRRETQKGTSEPRLAANRPSAHAKPRHADPQRRPPAKWMNWNKPPSPNREKATRGASASKGRAEPRRFG